MNLTPFMTDVVIGVVAIVQMIIGFFLHALYVSLRASTKRIVRKNVEVDVVITVKQKHVHMRMSGYGHFTFMHAHHAKQAGDLLHRAAAAAESWEQQQADQKFN